MFITDRLVYIQMQKTACTRIAEILAETVGGQSVDRKHGYLDQKPRNKIVVGSIRDPWAWYVSLWAFGCTGRGGVLAQLKGDPQWMALYADASDPRLFQAWLKQVYTERYANRIHRGAYGRFSLCGVVGFMTYRYLYLHNVGIGLDGAPDFAGYDELKTYDQRHNMVDAWIRAEVMAHDLARALVRAGYQVDAVMRTRLNELCQVRTNTSDHLDTMAYYDEESARMVMDRERLIFERHGYG